MKKLLLITTLSFNIALAQTTTPTSCYQPCQNTLEKCITTCQTTDTQCDKVEKSCVNACYDASKSCIRRACGPKLLPHNIECLNACDKTYSICSKQYCAQAGLQGLCSSQLVACTLRCGK